MTSHDSSGLVISGSQMIQWFKQALEITQTWPSWHYLRLTKTQSGNFLPSLGHQRFLYSCHSISVVGSWLLDVTTGPPAEGENRFVIYWISVGKAIFLPLVMDNSPFSTPKKETPLNSLSRLWTALLNPVKEP